MNSFWASCSTCRELRALPRPNRDDNARVADLPEERWRKSYAARTHFHSSPRQAGTCGLLFDCDWLRRVAKPQQLGQPRKSSSQGRHGNDCNEVVGSAICRLIRNRCGSGSPLQGALVVTIVKVEEDFPHVPIMCVKASGHVARRDSSGHILAQPIDQRLDSWQ